MLIDTEIVGMPHLYVRFSHWVWKITSTEALMFSSSIRWLCVRWALMFRIHLLAGRQIRPVTHTDQRVQGQNYPGKFLSARLLICNQVLH